MSYRFKRALLIAGVVLGFGSGIVSIAHRHHGCSGHGGHAGWHHRKERLMNQFAQACVKAAKETAR